MSLTIARNLAGTPTYPMLCKLAEQHHVRILGNERTGSFSCRGVVGDYAFGQNDLHGRFTSHGVTAEFSFQCGQAAVTVINKPFWLPERILNQKITQGLDTLAKELARLEPCRG